MENVSKHFYRETKTIIKHRLEDWILLKNRLVELDVINQSLLGIELDCNENFQAIQMKLQTAADNILEKLRRDVEHYI